MHSKSVVCFKVDLKGNVLFSNDGYKKVLKYEEENIEQNMINPTLKQLVAHESQDVVFDGIITLRKDGPNSSFNAKVYRDGDTLIFLCEYDSSEVEDLYKKMSSNTGLINNMNRELLKTQFTLNNTIQELKETQALLIHSEKMNALGQLVAGIAHEINNPMGYVTGNIQVAEDYATSLISFIEALSVKGHEKFEDLKETYDVDYILADILNLLEATTEGAQRVNKIVAELRDFSRIDSSERNVCNIEECIKSALIIANSEIANKNLALKLVIEETTDIECYPAQLNQVFLNLIINAIQAVEEYGEISISLYEKETDIYIEIEDNGCGISDENKDRIYDAFFTTKGPGEGVGLGLNIVYKTIKDMHHGQVLCESTLNKGTKFILLLPKNVQL